MKPLLASRKKRHINSHAVVIAALSFLLVLIIGELIVYIIQTLNNELVADGTFVTLYVIPSVAVIVTVAVIFLNHRTLATAGTLVNALNKVAEGDYSVKIPYNRQDSFNSVYENFNKMTDELKSVKTLREDFVHNFSHEFKTPIASINGFANLLLDGNLSEDERRSITKIIADESARLSRLAENTLLLSKIENQQFVGETKPFRLDLQITDCIILLQKQWEDKNITIKSSMRPVRYVGDEMLLKQVWLNLISNAIKYTQPCGEIEITLSAEGGRAVACVADNGAGISEENLPHIFEKYYQANGGSGNGLGLAICKRICELCGGEITVRSKPGEGSAFTVRL